MKKILAALAILGVFILAGTTFSLLASSPDVSRADEAVVYTDDDLKGDDGRAENDVDLKGDDTRAENDDDLKDDSRAENDDDLKGDDTRAENDDDSRDNDAKKQTQRAPETDVISADQAAEAAVKAIPGKVTELDRDSDDGKVEYEVEIVDRNHHEKEVTVDGKTGKVTAERDDDDDRENAEDDDEGEHDGDGDDED